MTGGHGLTCGSRANACSSKRNGEQGARTRVNRWAHPRSSSSPGAALGSVPTVALSSASGSISIASMIKTENIFDHVTVLIRRLRASESLRLPASSMRPLDLAISARRETDCGAARSPAGRSNRFYRCRAHFARARTYLTVRGRPRRDG